MLECLAIKPEPDLTLLWARRGSVRALLAVPAAAHGDGRGGDPRAEDLGLVTFIAIEGVNAGAGLVTQLSGPVFLKIIIAGFIVTTIPPIMVWAIGYHGFKVNAALLAWRAPVPIPGRPARLPRRSAAPCRLWPGHSLLATAFVWIAV